MGQHAQQGWLSKKRLGLGLEMAFRSLQWGRKTDFSMVEDSLLK